MKIWIDFINTPQVQFFVPFINDFKSDGHEIILTCRDSGNTVDLLEENNLPVHIIGRKKGKNKIKELFLFIRRIYHLFSYIKKNRPDIAVSQSSFYQPVVARMLGVPCLYTNDNEHAKGNLLAFVFAGRVILPEALKNKKFTRRWPLKNKVSFYPSVKEAVYLSQQPELVKKGTHLKHKIYFRPEPSSAQYYTGPLNFFDDILIKLSKEYEIVVLPRDNRQKEHYSQPKFASIKIPARPLSLQSIVSDCVLFIGAGGSMTRELATLQIPVLSIYQAEMLSVDKYLLEQGLINLKPGITYDEVRNLINSTLIWKNGFKVLKEGNKSYSLLKNSIYQLQYKK
jgi:uncharacterized protein